MFFIGGKEHFVAVLLFPEWVQLVVVRGGRGMAYMFSIIMCSKFGSRPQTCLTII